VPETTCRELSRDPCERFKSDFLFKFAQAFWQRICTMRIFYFSGSFAGNFFFFFQGTEWSGIWEGLPDRKCHIRSVTRITTRPGDKWERRGSASLLSPFTGADLAEHGKIVTNSYCQLLSLLASLSIKERRFRICTFRLCFFPGIRTKKADGDNGYHE
jgi:hypothetical protein